MTRTDFTEMFDSVQMDPDARKVFLAMPREEQLLAILGMQAWTRSELVIVKRQVIETQSNLEEFKKESRKYRARRRAKSGEEAQDDDTMTTTQKINSQISKPWVWFRDRVLPQIILIISLAILYQAFGGKLQP
jgi:hypothetical protein